MVSQIPADMLQTYNDRFANEKVGEVRQGIV